MIRALIPLLALTGCDTGSDLDPGAHVAIAGGMVYTCGVDGAGVMDCWGMPMEPESGTPELPYPDAVFTALSADAGNTCGLKDDGTAVCWGGYFEGIDDVPAATGLEQISMGRYHACGLHDDGEITCWGTDAVPPAGPFAQVSAGSDFTCAVTVSGELTCWGNILYDSFLDNMPTGDIVSVDASGIPCALDASGEVTCWDYTYTDLGLLKDHAVDELHTGASFLCGLTAEGSIVCDGEDEYGQTSPPKGTWQTLGLGYDHGCAVDEDGETACWGADGNDQATP